MIVETLEGTLLDEIVAIKGNDTKSTEGYEFYNAEVFEFFGARYVDKITTVNNVITITLFDLTDNEVHEFFDEADERTE